MLPPVLLLAARTVIGVTFVVAGLGKALTPPSRTAATIRSYGISSVTVARAGSGALPAVELVLGLCIVSGFSLEVSCIATVALLLLFNWLVFRSLRRGSDFTCSCFGILSQAPIGFGLILRNSGLIGLAVCVLAGRAQTGLFAAGVPDFRDYPTGIATPAALLIYCGLLLLFMSALALLGQSSVLFAAQPANHGNYQDEPVS
jgi:uncharacterized membrane protein YphA (DoxX/SURF4 family)